MSQFVSYRRRAGCGVLRLAGEAGISEASAVHAATLRAARDSQAGSIRLELGEATRIDLCVLQVIAALEADLRRQGKTLVVVDASAALSQAFSYAGLAI